MTATVAIVGSRSWTDFVNVRRHLNDPHQMPRVGWFIDRYTDVPQPVQTTRPFLDARYQTIAHIRRVQGMLGMLAHLCSHGRVGYSGSLIVSPLTRFRLQYWAPPYLVRFDSLPPALVA